MGSLLQDATRRSEAVVDAYEALAPFYDRFTAAFEHEVWLGNIESWARAYGLEGRRLVDIACGTGKSFAPFMARGYAVTACDFSERMVELARLRAGPDARVCVADMRALPWRSSFDLATCI